MSRTLSRTERDYDLGVVINPDVGDDQARAIVERVSQTIAANGGQLVRVNAVGRRRLAYPIEHHRDGLYFFFDLSLPPTAAGEVERALRVNEEIIRHLMIVRDPRLVAQQRQREAERAAEREAAEAQAALQREAEAAAAPAVPVASVAEAPVDAIPAETAIADTADEDTADEDTADEDTADDATTDEDADAADEEETETEPEANTEA